MAMNSAADEAGRGIGDYSASARESHAVVYDRDSRCGAAFDSVSNDAPRKHATTAMNYKSRFFAAVDFGSRFIVAVGYGSRFFSVVKGKVGSGRKFKAEFRARHFFDGARNFDRSDVAALSAVGAPLRDEHEVSVLETGHFLRAGAEGREIAFLPCEQDGKRRERDALRKRGIHLGKRLRIRYGEFDVRFAKPGDG